MKILLLFESKTNASNFRPEGSRPWNLCTSASNSLSVIPYEIDLANDCKQKGVLVSPKEGEKQDFSLMNKTTTR